MRWPFPSICVILRSADRGKACPAGNDHIVVPAGTMDDEQSAVYVPAADDAHMGVIGVKHQIARLSILPADIGAIAVLHGGSSAVANDVTAARGIVEHPINES